MKDIAHYIVIRHWSTWIYTKMIERKCRWHFLLVFKQFPNAVLVILKRKQKLYINARDKLNFYYIPVY